MDTSQNGDNQNGDKSQTDCGIYSQFSFISGVTSKYFSSEVMYLQLLLRISQPKPFFQNTDVKLSPLRGRNNGSPI